MKKQYFINNINLACVYIDILATDVGYVITWMYFTN